MAIPSTLEALLTEHDVARLTGLSVASVRRWRLRRKGPRYVKIGAAVRYRPEDLAAWLEAHTRTAAKREAAEALSPRPEAAKADEVPRVCATARLAEPIKES